MSAAYNMPLALRLRGALDAAALERALDEIVRRHEALRTTFAEVTGSRCRRIAPADIALGAAVEYDLRGHGAAASRNCASSWWRRRRWRASTWSRARWSAGGCCGWRRTSTCCCWRCTTSSRDGWSMGVLVRELSALYGAFQRGEADPLCRRCRCSTRTTRRGSGEWLKGEVLEQQREYWKQQLAGAPPVLELPTDRPRPPRAGPCRGACWRWCWPTALTAALKELGRRQGATLFMTLLAAWALLLSRYIGQEDVVVGTPIADRNRAEIEGLIGFFVNTLALRVDCPGEPTLPRAAGAGAAQRWGPSSTRTCPSSSWWRRCSRRAAWRTPAVPGDVRLQQGSAGGAGAARADAVAAGRRRRSTAKFDLTLSLRETRTG